MGESPYLPYGERQLSIGQIVKILLPGKENGVAMARVIYISKDANEISVVLISEPKRFVIFFIDIKYREKFNTK